MALEIRKDDTQSIAAIKELTDASLDQFISALDEAPPVSNPRDMAKHIAKQVPKLAVDRLAGVLETLYTLYNIRDLSGVKPSRFLDDLVDGIRSDASLKIEANDISRLRSVLERLMSIATLSTVSKAARLQRDGERIYCTAKILSDVRPVFSGDPTARPLGAVLAHTLKIGYHEGREHREFHVILDAEDLSALDEVVRRAQAKDKTLREVLKDAQLPALDE